MKLRNFTFLLGFFTLIGVAVAQPGPPTLLSPADNATDVPTNVVLDWDTLTADSFHIEISSTSDFLTLVLDTVQADTSTEFMVTSGALMNNMTYYWRIAGYNADGMGSYSAEWSFTVEQTTPGAVTLLSPADAENNVAITPSFDWTDDSQADNYEIIVARDAALTDVVEHGFPTASNYTLVAMLKNDSTYYWQVIASNGVGNTASSIFNFTVLPAPPAQVTLVSPADNATMVSLTPTLKWNLVSGATSYKILVSANSNLSSPVLDTTISSNDSVIVAAGKLSSETLYYWAVAASNGTFGPYSTTNEFTTVGTPPAAPSLVSPMSSTVGAGLSPTLQWTAVSTATTYHVHVSTYPNFADTSYLANVNTTSHMVSDELTPYTVYYWRVAAENSFGISEWSPYWNFTTLYTSVVSITKGDFNLSVYPNPAASARVLSFNLEKNSPVEVFVTDINGKRVMKIADENMESGLQEINFSTETLSSGVYMLSLTQEGITQTIKLVVQ